MKRYKAIVFDFDMTLADSSHVIVDLLNVCASHFGFPAKSHEEIMPVVGNTHEIMLSYVTGVKDDAELLTMREHYRGLCRAEMARRTEFFPDARDCIEAVSKKGFRIGLLSLKLREVLMETLEKDGLERYFDIVLGCEEVPAQKPDPSGLLIAMRELEIGSASDLLYIGDSLVDQNAAASAGTDFAAMLLGGTRRDQFDQKLVTRFYTSLDELRKEVEQLQ